MVIRYTHVVNTAIDELREYNQRVDLACRHHLGITAMAWRALESLVSLVALVVIAFAIEQGTDPTLAIIIAAVIIQGPRIIEWWMVREDFVDYEDIRDTRRNE